MTRAHAHTMFILHTDTDDLGNPLRGGQPVRTYEINSRLGERHDITVLTSVYKGCRRRETRDSLQYRRLGFRLPPFGLSPHMSFLASLGPAVRAMRHDLIVEEFTPPVGFCMLPWWTGRPVISMVQWFFFNAWEQRYHLPFSRWMRGIAARGRYRYFIAQTRAMSSTLRELAPQALIRTIPCGISQSAFIKAREQADYALFLGRIDRQHKGLDLLLEAWSRSCAAADIPLIIAGEGPDRLALEQEAAARGLSRLIRFTGRVEEAAKAELLSKCRFMVMPSRFETFGIAALEAMAAEKPVVVFAIDHLDEVVRPEWGAVVQPFDTGAFARAVCGLWTNSDRCRSLGAAARQAATEYLWDRIALQQEDFYVEVLAAHREQTVKNH